MKLVLFKNNYGPWGGGNLFAQNLTDYMKEKGHSNI